MNIKDIAFIPVSALKGDMVVKRGKNMPWYGGDTLLYYLENIPLASGRDMINFRLPIQQTLKVKNKRFYAGKIDGGTVRSGEEIMIIPSMQKARIKEVLVSGEKSPQAFNPQSVAVSLTKELDVSRGDMIVRPNNIPETAKEIELTLCWLSQSPLKLNQSYFLKHTTRTTRCYISNISYKIDVNNLHRQKCASLKINDIARVTIRTNDPLFFDIFNKNKNTGSVILIDEITKSTVAAGMILRKGSSVKDIKKGAPVLWFTGLSGAGKSTIAARLLRRLRDKNIACEHLDGDHLRSTLNKDLGFSKADRDKNIERAVFVADLLAKHQVVVLASFISPYRQQRQKARAQLDNFIEIFVDAPLELCRQRDVKGLYKEAKQSKIKNFTGVGDPYERPLKPEITLNTDKFSVDECLDKIINYLQLKKHLF